MILQEDAESEDAWSRRRPMAEYQTYADDWPLAAGVSRRDRRHGQADAYGLLLVYNFDRFYTVRFHHVLSYPGNLRCGSDGRCNDHYVILSSFSHQVHVFCPEK